MITRRHILAAGGGGLATLAMPSILRAQATEVIEMRGTPRGGAPGFGGQTVPRQVSESGESGA